MFSLGLSPLEAGTWARLCICEVIPGFKSKGVGRVERKREVNVGVLLRRLLPQVMGASTMRSLSGKQEVGDFATEQGSRSDAHRHTPQHRLLRKSFIARSTGEETGGKCLRSVSQIQGFEQNLRG